ncbi:uncharacterized protein BYT42DRAFT_558768 [Radiomyces spectabilis]|uniref:uncharacterized protein n=1 Tax=Radiomyces spectabilis TaxID=64574 RepID=UPI00222118C7|nr:uncharacterized protein BYT42DRAFT_558768 [Radiomyces spectabilis]KAI8388051.1 hypothetical protein BYT42DRAFT_558768 [Radiomyces spectabilis]
MSGRSVSPVRIRSPSRSPYEDCPRTPPLRSYDGVNRSRYSSPERPPRSRSPYRGRSHSRSRSPRSPRPPRSRSPRSRSHSHGSRSPPYRRESSSRSYRRRSMDRHASRYPSRSPSPRHSRRSRSPLRRYHSRSVSPRRNSRPGFSQNKDARVYVGNLSFDATWRDLKDFMREIGPVVHADILTLPGTRKSKGCGIVEYRYSEDAQRAIRKLHKVDFMGRPVFLREDREHDHVGPPRESRDVPDDCRLFVGNLPYAASWQDMKDLFRRAGRVIHTDIHTEPMSRRSKGTGIVIFDNPHDARAAIDMFDNYEWQGRRLEVVEERDAHNRRPVPRPDIRDSREVVPPPRTVVDNDTGYPAVPPPPPNVYAAERYPPMYDGPLYPPMPPPPHFDPLSVSVVGGPGAALPSHGPNQIFVNNLPFSTTWQDLIDLFRHVGPVVRSEILLINGQPKGAGLVRFENFVTCERAIDKFNGYLYGGRYLDIRIDKFSAPA